MLKLHINFIRKHTMKKLIIFILILQFCIIQTATFAIDNETEPVPPKWEDWVPEKYQNPREDFTRKASIAEMSVGIVLTDLLITAPIGIPLICHGTTKFKHVSYRDKKERFEDGLAYAQTIKSPQERQTFYNKLPKKCGLKVKTHKKIMKQKEKEKENTQI